jgi:hypothetical protein
MTDGVRCGEVMNDITKDVRSGEIEREELRSGWIKVRRSKEERN